MSCSKKIKDFLCTFDLFSQNVSLRYKDQPQYQTATGGLISLGLIVAFIAIFTSTTISTLNRTTISSQVTLFQQTIPSYFKTDLKNNFMFAIGLTDINLNKGQRYFDITFQFKNYSDTGHESIVIPLEQCKIQVWQSFGNQFANYYDRERFNQWLCPPSHITLELQGKFTSEFFKFYKISIAKCQNSTDSSRSCATDAQIANYLLFDERYLNFYFINTLLNPSNHTHLKPFLEDTNFIRLSRTITTVADVFINSFSVQTDESIWPFEDINITSGGFVAQSAIKSYQQTINDTYIKIFLRKSPISYQITRSFRKADDQLSYIGGLFSSILALMLFMSLFGQISFELSMAKSLFVQKRNKQIQANSFNIFVYFGYLIYLGFTKIGIQLNWPTMISYHQTLQQIRQQLDIRLVMKRLLFAEKIYQLLLQDHQLALLHMQQPTTLQQAQRKRKLFKNYKQLKRKIKNQQFSFEQQNNNKNNQIDLYGRSSSNLKSMDQNISIAQQPYYLQHPKLQLTLSKKLSKLDEDIEKGNKISSIIKCKVDKEIQKKFEEQFKKKRKKKKNMESEDN